MKNARLRSLPVILMNSIDHYIQAATRDNTRRSYRSAIEHYEVVWGGFLPTTAETVARYLADHAQVLSANTLKQRLAALAQWHSDQGFPDPTKAPVVKKVLKGIKELHPTEEKRAKPLQLDELSQLIQWIDRAIGNAIENDHYQALLTLSRNKALVLVGFWRGFRSDELCRLEHDFINVTPGEGMRIFLPRSKGDRQNIGQYFHVPALSRLCPVAAYQDWINVGGISYGPIFRSINRWGQLSEHSLNPNSIVPLLRTIFRQAGLSDPDSFSSHSLRRGFATWANAHHWDMKSLMEYVGWKDIKSAMRYIDQGDKFAQHKIESALAISAPKTPETP